MSSKINRSENHVKVILREKSPKYKVILREKSPKYKVIL